MVHEHGRFTVENDPRFQTRWPGWGCEFAVFSRASLCSGSCLSYLPGLTLHPQSGVLCDSDVAGGSGCLQCTSKCPEWSSRIKRSIPGVLWRHSCSPHQTVMSVPNWLERKASYNRFFCETSSCLSTWEKSRALFPHLNTILLHHVAGFFPSEIFSCFSSDFERHVLLIIFQQPQAWRSSTVVLFHAHRVHCAWKLF